MSKPPTMSGRASRHLHRKSLVIGPVLLLLTAGLLALPLLIAETGNGKFGGVITVLLFTMLLWAPGLVLTIVGALGEAKARRTNRDDWATAEALAVHADQLLAQPPSRAYTSDAVIHLDPQRVLEVERHFDEKTAGEARGTLMHQFSMFGHSFGLGYAAGQRTTVAGGVHSAAIKGMSDVHLSLSSTTRHDLMGDALFALFETRDADGMADTLRVTALSNGAVMEWIHGLIA